MEASDQASADHRFHQALAIIPFLSNFGRPQRAVIEVYFGDLTIKMPSRFGVHADANGMAVIMIARLRTRTDRKIVEKDGHQLPVADKCQMVPAAIAEKQR